MSGGDSVSSKNPCIIEQLFPFHIPVAFNARVWRHAPEVFFPEGPDNVLPEIPDAVYRDIPYTYFIGNASRVIDITAAAFASVVSLPCPLCNACHFIAGFLQKKRCYRTVHAAGQSNNDLFQTKHLCISDWHIPVKPGTMDLTSQRYTARAILSKASANTALGQAMLIRWKPSPAWPKIAPLSSHNPA